MASTGATFQYDPMMILPQDEDFLEEMGGEKLDNWSLNRDSYKPFLFRFTFHQESRRWDPPPEEMNNSKAPILAIGVNRQIAKFENPYRTFIDEMRKRGVIFGPIPISFVPMEPLGPFSENEAIRTWLEKVSPSHLVKSANKTGPGSFVQDE
jgi:hypothetical protein